MSTKNLVKKWFRYPQVTLSSASTKCFFDVLRREDQLPPIYISSEEIEISAQSYCSNFKILSTSKIRLNSATFSRLQNQLQTSIVLGFLENTDSMISVASFIDFELNYKLTDTQGNHPFHDRQIIDVQDELLEKFNPDSSLTKKLDLNERLFCYTNPFEPGSFLIRTLEELEQEIQKISDLHASLDKEK